MKKGIYIILALVGVAVVAFLVFGRKKDTAADGSAGSTANATDDKPTNWFTSFGTSTAGIGSGFNTWQNWFADRQASNWSFNTNLVR